MASENRDDAEFDVEQQVVPGVGSSDRKRSVVAFQQLCVADLQ